MPPPSAQQVREAYGEESVEELLARLAEKGQKVQLVDDNGKTKDQQREIVELQGLMKQMENQLVQGGHAMADKEKENAHHRREMQLKLQQEIEKQE
jgi:hypothetical protein